MGTILVSANNESINSSMNVTSNITVNDTIVTPNPIQEPIQKENVIIDRLEPEKIEVEFNNSHIRFYNNEYLDLSLEHIDFFVPKDLQDKLAYLTPCNPSLMVCQGDYPDSIYGQTGLFHVLNDWTTEGIDRFYLNTDFIYTYSMYDNENVIPQGFNWKRINQEIRINYSNNNIGMDEILESGIQIDDNTKIEIELKAHYNHLIIKYIFIYNDEITGYFEDVYSGERHNLLIGETDIYGYNTKNGMGSRIVLRLDNLYNGAKEYNLTIAYPKNKKLINSNFNDSFKYENNLYEDVIIKSQEVNKNQTLLENQEDYIIESYKVFVDENIIKSFWYVVERDLKEELNLRMWITGSYLGGSGWDIGQNSTYTFEGASESDSKYTVTLSEGIYKIEVFGASGGDNYDSSYLGGTGGYIKGYYNSTEDDEIEIWVGQVGKTPESRVESATGGWGKHSGGNGRTVMSTGASSGAGGGSTEIIFNSSILAVADSGGGAGGTGNSGGGGGGARCGEHGTGGSFGDGTDADCTTIGYGGDGGDFVTDNAEDGGQEAGDYLYNITTTTGGGSSSDGYVIITFIDGVPPTEYYADLNCLSSYTDSAPPYSLDYVHAVEITPDNNYLITSSRDDDSIAIMNITNKTNMQTVASYSSSSGAYSLDKIYGLTVTADGNYVITSSFDDDTVAIFNITNKSEIVPVASYTDSTGEYSLDQIFTLDVTQDGNYLITTSYLDSVVSVMNITNKSEIVPVSSYADSSGEFSLQYARSVAVSYDGNYIITSSYGSSAISVFDITNKSVIDPLDSYISTSGTYSVYNPHSIAITADDDYVIASSFSHDNVVVLDITNKSNIVPTAAYTDTTGDYSTDGIISVDVTPDGNYVVTSSVFSHVVSVMNITNKSEIVTIDGNGTYTYTDTVGDCSIEYIRELAVSPDGLYLATTSSTDDTVSLLTLLNEVEEEEPTDTCTCPGSNTDWNVDMSDYCVIETACNIGTGKLIFTNTGNFTIDATVTTAGIDNLYTNQIIYMKSNGLLTI
jgi:6-phosphogluconolactonase (cycloisomerase 2 family)